MSYGAPQDRLTALGLRVRQVRLKRGLTHDVLAGLAAKSDKWISQLEAGHVNPKLTDLELVAEALETDVRWLLGLDSPKDDVKRRQALKAIGISLAAAAVDPRFLLNDIPRRATERLVEDQAEVLAQYAALYWRLSPTTMQRLLADHQANLLSLLRVAPAGGERPLQVLAAETSRLAGLAAYDQNDLGTARRYFEFGEQLATAAGDGPVLAGLLTSHRCAISATDQRGGGDRVLGHQAIALLDAGNQVAGSTCPREIRTWLYCSRAEEHAALGRDLEAFRDLDRAASALAATSSPASPTSFFTVWNQTRLDGWRASVLLYLNRPLEAAEILEKVVPATPSSALGYRCAALAGLAAAYASGGEVDRAAVLASESLQLARQGGLEEGIGRIRRVRDSLDRFASDPAVRHLDDQLKAVS